MEDQDQALRNSIAASVQRVAAVLAPPIEARLVDVYRREWLTAVNERRSSEGRAPGRGLHDPRFVLALLGYDPAFERWADEGWRERARWLNAVANRAYHGEPVTADESAHAQRVAVEFVEGWGEPASIPDDEHDHTALDTLDAVQQLIETGDLATAESMTRHQIEAGPHDALPEFTRALLYAFLAKILVEQGRGAQGLEALETAEVLGYRDEGVSSFLRGRVLFSLERWEEALVALREATRISYSNEGAVWSLMYAAALRAGNSQAQLEAAEGWAAADNYSPEALRDPMALKYLTETLVDTRPADARAAAQRWIELAPDDEWAIRYCMLCCADAGDHEGALELIEKHPKLFEDDSQALALKARALGKLGRHREAVALGEQVVRSFDLPPESVLGAWMDQAWSLFELGLFPGAAAAARRVLREKPENEWCWSVLTRALAEQGLWSESLDAAERWLEVVPLGAAWSFKVRALQGLERKPEALEAARTVHAMAPDDPNALSLLATAEASVGDYVSSQSHAERWVALDPRNAMAWYSLASGLLHLGRIEEAVEAARQMIAIEPETPDMLSVQPGLLSLLVRAEAATGDFISARAHAEQWVAIDPDSPAAREALGEIRAALHTKDS